MIESRQRKFEIPYNFDKQLINGINILHFPKQWIDCFYLPPFPEDYETIRRGPWQAWDNITEDKYLDHLKYIDNFYNKKQLLLQRKDIIMTEKLLEKYINLDFRNFCCGSIEQAKIIKKFDSNLKTVASITMHIQPNQINDDIQKYFDSIVLDFSYSKNLNKIKQLPKNIEYIILCNTLCNNNCDGTHHWEALIENPNNNYYCPGMFPRQTSFYESCNIRPMDLYIFDPYIKIYKIQDRGWPTSYILRDLVLYTTNFFVYPLIDYDENLYNKKGLDFN